MTASMENQPFDPYDWNSMYFGKMSREEAERSLSAQAIGTFLVRDSSKGQESYVLSVREETTKNEERAHFTHYLINAVDGRFLCGNHSFVDVAQLLHFFAVNQLETTLLTMPLVQSGLIAVALDDCDAPNTGDLWFRRGDRLTIMERGDRCIGRNSLGLTGSVARHLIEVRPPCPMMIGQEMPNDPSPSSVSTRNDDPSLEQCAQEFLQLDTPFNALVTHARRPCAYAGDELVLHVNDVVKVTRVDVNGMFDASLAGNLGTVPATHIQRMTA